MKSHLVCKSTSLCVEFNDCARESFVYALFCVRGKKSISGCRAPSWINSTLIDKF